MIERGDRFIQASRSPAHAPSTAINTAANNIRARRREPALAPSMALP
jgi:hypothetical protein